MIPVFSSSKGALRTCVTGCPSIFVRHKSLHAAIERGTSLEGSRFGAPRERRDFGGPRRSNFYEDEGRNSRRDYEGPSIVRSRDQRRTSRRGEGRSSPSDRPGVYTPENLPYTTAASEFLYGYSSVFAALKSGKRKLYKLYIHDRGAAREGHTILAARARAAGVPIQKVGDNYLPLMDKASSGRPHNGFILEASPLPRTPITKLSSYSKDAGTFKVQLDRQSREEKQVNGTQDTYKYKPGGWRYPFVLYVDGVLNEGNLGAIARSAYFLGVDAIATPTRQSAPWDHVAVKASAGAAEAIPLFAVNQPAAFLTESAREGWRVYASDAVTAEKPRADLAASGTTVEDDTSSAIVFALSRQPRRLPADHSPLASHPTILLMGSEDSGLRTSLLNAAHYKVGIRSGRGTDEVGVDSLNVSVAASLLAFEFLKKPSQTTRKAGEYIF